MRLTGVCLVLAIRSYISKYNLTAECCGVEDPDSLPSLSCCSTSRRYQADKPHTKYYQSHRNYPNILFSVCQDFVSCCVGNFDCLDLCSR